MSCSWFVQSRFVSFSCFMHTRFKWYNIRRPAIDPKQADPTYYENLALSVPLAQGYIDRLGEIWFEMVSVSRDVNFKRDDILIKHDSTHWLPHVDIKQPKAEYESVKALETAPDSVKKLFSIEFGRRKDLTFQWKRALMNKVRQNELDTSSLEVRIAKHTALIRHWSKLLSEMKSWNDVVRNFRSKMVLKNHWRYFTIYPNTFTGQEATDWLYNYLISKTKSKSKITKEKVKILLKKFYEREVFVEVIHSKKSKDEIIKDGRSLYRFTDTPLSALVQTPLALKMNRIKKEVHAMCPEKRHSAGLPSNLLEREKILCNTNRSVSMENIPFENHSQKACKRFSSSDIDNLWKTCCLDSIKSFLAVDNLKSFIEESAIDASLIFYNANQFEIASKVNSNIDEPPPQIVQSMNCLANWPRRNEGVHIGFEMDILQTLATFFRNQKLIPKGLLMLSFTIMERARQLDGKLSNHMHYCARNSAFLSHSDLSCDYLAPVHRVSKNVTPLFQSNQTGGASLKKYSAIVTDEKPVMMNRYCLASSNSPKDKLEALSGLPGLVKSPTLVKTLEENTELLECPVSLKSFVKVQRAATLSTPKQRPRHLAGQFNVGDGVQQSLERRTFSTLFPISFRLSHVKELTIETVRNCFFMLDVKRRRWLQLLLRFMARVSTNHRLQLDKYGTTSNRVLVVDAFSSCFCLNEEKRRAVELLKFLLHHQLEIFAPSKRLEHDVNARISQLIFDEQGSIEEGISITSSLSLISRNDHGDGNFDDTKNTDQCVLLKNSNKQKNSNESSQHRGETSNEKTEHRSIFFKRHNFISRLIGSLGKKRKAC